MAIDYEDATSFWELLERRTADTPDAPFLLDEAGTTVTFGEGKARAERIAAGLNAMGIGQGSAVVWQLPSTINTVLFSLALARLGAIQTPVLHLYRDKEVGFCIDQARPVLVVGPGTWGGHDYHEMHTLLAAGKVRDIVTLTDNAFDSDPAALPPYEQPEGEPIRWVYYTSGTTSDPKGVQHTDRTLAAAGLGLAIALDAGPDDLGSVAFPFAHIAGPDYLAMILFSGMPAVLIEQFTPDGAIETFNRLGVTQAGGSTAFYTMYLNEQRKNPDKPLIPTLKSLSGGGAPKPPELYFEVQKEMGIPVLHGYGMTECPMISQGSPSDTDDQLAYSDGAPIKDCEITIVTADGKVAEPGEEGEVRLRGPMVFKGYTDASLNEDAFDSEGRFRSGDLGKIRPDGHVALTGRLKDVIIRKGENISAKEVEDVLFTHPKVGEVAVIGLVDRERGERVCAVIELADGAEPLTFDEMSAHCAEAGLMRQKTPEQLEIVDELPRNDTLRKVLKYKLRDMFND